MINWQLSKQGIRWPASPDRIAGSGVNQVSGGIEIEYFEVICWQVTSFQMIAGSSFFILFYEICCVYVPLGINFNFKLTSDTKIQPAITGREDSCFWLFSPWSRVGHALRPIFMRWLVKVIKGEFMRKIYAASWILFTLTAKADRIVSTCDALNCFFSTGCTKWNSAYNKLSKQHRLQEYSKCRASSNAFKEYTSL